MTLRYSGLCKLYTKFSNTRHLTFFCVFRIEANKVVCYAHPDAPLIEDYRAGDMICSECGLVVGDR